MNMYTHENSQIKLKKLRVSSPQIQFVGGSTPKGWPLLHANVHTVHALVLALPESPQDPVGEMGGLLCH